MGTALSASSPKRRFESARPRVLLLDRRGGFCETSERPLHPADSDARRAPGTRQGGPIRLEAGRARRSATKAPALRGLAAAGRRLVHEGLAASKSNGANWAAS